MMRRFDTSLLSRAPLRAASVSVALLALGVPRANAQTPAGDSPSAKPAAAAYPAPPGAAPPSSAPTSPSPTIPSAGATAVPAGAAKTPPSPTAGLPPGHVPVDPHSRVGAHGMVNPHAPSPAQQALLAGHPFASPQHSRQAELARAGQQFLPKVTNALDPKMPPGTIGIVVRDADGKAVPNLAVTLKITRESIEKGNQHSELETKTNRDGYAGFVDRDTASSYLYEVITHNADAVISSGEFRLDRAQGRIIGLHYYPTTSRIEDAFVFSRVLYVVQPRDDVFQIQALYRLENTNPIIWTPDDFLIRLPPRAQAFQPGNVTGDLRLSSDSGAIHIDGSFGPGQHEIAYNFQLPNDGDTTVNLELPEVPHMVDAKVILEASPQMTLQVSGLEAATETRGNDGQRALMTIKDWLRSPGQPPERLVATITGLPTKGNGPIVASAIAGVIALLGIASAASNRARRGDGVAGTDRARARQLLLDELVLVERAYRDETIGKKTYEQARRTLIDALARIEAGDAVDASA